MYLEMKMTLKILLMTIDQFEFIILFLSCI